MFELSMSFVCYLERISLIGSSLCLFTIVCGKMFKVAKLKRL